MKLDEEQKQAVYQQIRAFNDQLSNPSITNSPKFQKAFFYVDDSSAEIAAKFLTYLIEQDALSIREPVRAIDLCFGSGNLTSHILLDNEFDVEEVVYNDKNSVNSNQAISLGGISTVWNVDITADDFDEAQFNFIVFNPQIGGSYTDGKLDWNSHVLTNIRRISTDDHVLVFLGELAKFKEHFSNLPSVAGGYASTGDEYKTLRILRNIVGGKDLIIASKTGEAFKQVCYKQQGKSFDVTDCEQVAEPTVDTSENLKDKMVDLEGMYGGLQSAFGENPLSLGGDQAGDRASKADGISVNTDQHGITDFPIKNLLLKGVPGTGKSYLIDQIIEKKLELDPHDADRVLRINIHSGSSNADLMHGIALATSGGNIEYKEKQGLIFDLLSRACAAPKQAFVLVLEEIQENSLNELIGDLIYLIEPEKRARIGEVTITGSFSSLVEMMAAYIDASDGSMKYVRIPNLVADGTKYRKMIFPDNLYIFCTSNYRDDKKIIEDNLLRRFDTLDVFPDPERVSSPEIKFLFSELNKAILEKLKDEVHPDRFEIGHAIWMNVQNEEASLARALYKALIELKEIREIQTTDIVTILKQVKDRVANLPPEIQGVLQQFNGSDLISFIKSLQAKAYPDVLDLLTADAGSQQSEELQGDDSQD